MSKQKQEEIFATLEESIALVCSEIQKFKLNGQNDFKKNAIFAFSAGLYFL